MTVKIKLTTIGLPVDGRRAAEPDLDHAVKILEMTKRGYTIAARGIDNSQWMVHFSYMNSMPFSNRPAGKTAVLFVRTYFGQEDARLFDKVWPEWIEQLVKFVRIAAPDNVYVQTGVYNLGEDDD